VTEQQGSLFTECSHPRTIVVPQKSGPHFARQICADCKKFLGWLPKPETIARRKENAEILTALSKLRGLSEWERGFIRDIASHKNLSPKQQSQIELLRDKYLKESPT
jgi:hypothetical protein